MWIQWPLAVVSGHTHLQADLILEAPPSWKFQQPTREEDIPECYGKKKKNQCKGKFRITAYEHYNSHIIIIWTHHQKHYSAKPSKYGFQVSSHNLNAHLAWPSKYTLILQLLPTICKMYSKYLICSSVCYHQFHIWIRKI